MKTSALIKLILILSVFEVNLLYGTKARYSVDELLKLAIKENHCDCTDQIKPVCGSNRRTYPNKCYMECSRKKDKGLRLVANISCEEIEKDEDGRCKCSEEIKPVCGSDDKTYYNECYLKCKKKYNKKLKLIVRVACDISEDQLNETEENETNEEETNRCRCSEKVQEVCASNGLTYKNHCFLRCHQKSDKSLTLVSNAACDCGCPNTLFPVCGSDGKTYHNKCYLKCRQKVEKNLTIVSNTSCYEIDHYKEDCGCGDKLHPVCGSNQRTYPNRCYFKCHQNKDKSLYLVSTTACHKIITSEEDCECSNVFHPVCGSDGKTYHNKCYFKCRQNDDKSLTLVSKTTCDEMSNSKEDCVCPDKFHPVCGSDRKTYHNKCYFKCRQNDDESLTLVSKTACDEISNSKEDCVCPDKFHPVCGSDGKTYPNKCYLKCRQNDDESLTLVSKTACNEIPNSEEDCECSDVLDAVGGSDGKTYTNRCYLKCRQNDHESLKLASKTVGAEIPNSEEDCECPVVFDPVCGSDGNAYPNKCYLKCRQNEDESLTLVSKTACDEISNYKEDCFCPFKFHPVCGSDGKTYPNKCYLTCRQNDNESLTLVSKTACDDNLNSKKYCVCHDEFHPVCGSDGKTYPNKCYFKCRQNDDESLTLVAKTACDQISNSTEACVCPDKFHPVCGSDRKTYHNKCYFKCRQNDDKSLTLVSKTACDEIPNYKEDCICPDVFHPVCGSNGKTYSNKCYFKCRQNDDKNLTLVSKKACDEIPISKKDCVCPSVLDPVCGSDGKTYPNKCYFKCRQDDDENLTLVSKTACDEVSNSKENCGCPHTFDPVCGSDKNTYSNKCLLQCSQKTDQSLKLYANKSCRLIKLEILIDELIEEAEPVIEDILKGIKPLIDETLKGIESTSLHVILSNLINLFPSTCKCPLINDPVCGNDLNTYTNPCVLNCYKKFNQDLRLHSHKACEENQQDRHKESKIHRCHCSMKFKPVCATDGEVYLNFCILKCYRKMYPQLKEIVRVPCKKHHKSHR